MTIEKQYLEFIADLKKNIIQSRYLAARLANKQQLTLYLQTGKMLAEKIAAEEWGAKVADQISEDLQKQLPGLKGFSRRNLMNMKRFYAEYQDIIFVQSLSAQFKHSSNITPADKPFEHDFFFSISFSHHLVILNHCRSLDERIFYIQKTASNFWSVRLLDHHIESDLYKHQGTLPNNFDKTLPTLQPSALQVFRDEYLLDFLSSADSEDERVLEEKVVADIKNFILRMGSGFCFLGNQYRIEVADEEFFIDLLFYNRHLQCLVAF
jgi:predicted nuclease of restriction endonuclease-like (RecB) superfamily